MGCNCKKRVNEDYADGETTEKRSRFLTFCMNVLLGICVLLITIVLFPVFLAWLFVSFVFKKPIDMNFLNKFVKSVNNG